MNILPSVALLPMALALAAPVFAASEAIYACTDAKGRRITSDRPIAECMDRKQHELTRFGTVKRTIHPPLSASEQAAYDEKEKAAAELAARQHEEKRRDKALLARYPNRTVHDRERNLVLAQLDESMNSALAAPSLAASATADAMKKRLAAAQEAEKQRVNERYDGELVRLMPLWGAVPAMPLASAPSR